MKTPLSPEQMREMAKIGSPIISAAWSDAWEKVHGHKLTAPTPNVERSEPGTAFPPDESV